MGGRRNQQRKQKQKLKKYHNFATVIGRLTPACIAKAITADRQLAETSFVIKKIFNKGRLTQLVRVPPLQGGSREFKSLIAHPSIKHKSLRLKTRALLFMGCVRFIQLKSFIYKRDKQKEINTPTPRTA